jgi:hypothetical protein
MYPLKEASSRQIRDSIRTSPASVILLLLMNRVPTDGDFESEINDFI